jgi:Fe(3+) dicitrate transport protein
MVAGLFAPALRGEDPGDAEALAEPDIVHLKEFAVIGSKEAVFALPGSGSYLDTEDLGRFQPDDVNKALRSIPGVYLREEDGYGLFPNISLRGVDTTRSGKLTVMEDGVPMAPAAYSAPSAYYTPTTGRMSGLEVLKGSSQIKYGPHTTGGAVNYLSTPVPGGRGGILKASTGTNEDVRVHVSYGERWKSRIGAIGTLLEAYHRETNGFKTIDAAGDYNGSGETGFERTDYMLKTNWQPKSEKRQIFEFKIGHTDLVANEGYLGLTEADFAATPYRRYAASRLDRIQTNHTRIYLKHEIQLGPNTRLVSMGYRNQFHRNWFKLNDIRDIDSDGDGIPEGDASGPGSAAITSSLAGALAGAVEGKALEVLQGKRAGNLRIRANNRDYTVSGVQTAIDHRFETGDLRHHLELGVRYHQDRIRRFQWHELYHQSSDGDFGAPELSPPGSDGNRLQSSKAVSTYLTDEITSGKWTFSPGLRYEHIGHEYTDFTTDGSNRPVFDDSGSMDLFVPGIGATFRLNENTLLFAGVHRGVSVPGPRDEVRNNVVEETSTAFEIGGRFNSGKNFSGEAVFFHTGFDNLIVIDNIGGAGNGTTENVGSVTSQGLELSLAYNPGTAADWDISTPLSLAFTYTDAVLNGDANSNDPESIFAGGTDGNRVPYIPEVQLNFTAGIGFKKCQAFFSATYISETYSSAANMEDPINPNTGTPDARFGTVGAHWNTDVSGFYRVNEKLRFFATVTNILDNTYAASRHPHGVRPGAPRLARFGFQLTY